MFSCLTEISSIPCCCGSVAMGTDANDRKRRAHLAFSLKRAANTASIHAQPVFRIQKVKLWFTFTISAEGEFETLVENFLVRWCTWTFLDIGLDRPAVLVVDFTVNNGTPPQYACS